MLWFLLVFGVFLLVIMNYTLWFREWLKTRPWPWSQRYFEWIEPIERVLYKKSETILLARSLQALGTISAFLTVLSGMDFYQLIAFIPERWQPWVLASPFIATTILGIVQEIQRRYTATPLDVIALPTLGNTPEVNIAVANLETAKAEVATAIADEKAAK